MTTNELVAEIDEKTRKPKAIRNLIGFYECQKVGTDDKLYTFDAEKVDKITSIANEQFSLRNYRVPVFVDETEHGDRREAFGYSENAKNTTSQQLNLTDEAVSETPKRTIIFDIDKFDPNALEASEGKKSLYERVISGEFPYISPEFSAPQGVLELDSWIIGKFPPNNRMRPIDEIPEKITAASDVEIADNVKFSTNAILLFQSKPTEREQMPEPTKSIDNPADYLASGGKPGQKTAEPVVKAQAQDDPNAPPKYATNENQPNNNSPANPPPPGPDPNMAPPDPNMAPPPVPDPNMAPPVPDPNAMPPAKPGMEEYPEMNVKVIQNEARIEAISDMLLKHLETSHGGEKSLLAAAAEPLITASAKPILALSAKEMKNAKIPEENQDELAIMYKAAQEGNEEVFLKMGSAAIKVKPVELPDKHEKTPMSTETVFKFGAEKVEFDEFKTRFGSDAVAAMDIAQGLNETEKSSCLKDLKGTAFNQALFHKIIQVNKKAK